MELVKKLKCAAVFVSALSAIPASSLAGETCWSVGAVQFADNVTYCVSSVLPPSGANSYGPENLVLGGDGTAAWCEGVEGDGIGQRVSIEIDRGSAFGRLLIVNGYPKSARTFSRNARVRTMRVTTDTGVDRMVNLSDHGDMQPIALGRVAAHARVELTIVEVYPGSKYRDTCIGFLSPDFEEIERRNMEATDSPPGAAQGDVAPADVSPGISPDVSPDGGDDRGLGELGFPGDAGLDLPRE